MKYLDLQVNGAFGVDFNDDALTAEAFEFACGKLKESGVIGFLATIITDAVATMCGRIEKIVRLLDTNAGLRQFVRGIHIEGPFLSDQSGFYGTHPSQHIQPANERDAMRLLEAGNGFVRLVTLAPEQDPDFSPEDARHSVIRWLPSTIENASGPRVADGLPEFCDFRPAALVAATVLSHPAPGRITLNAGSKAVSADIAGQTGTVLGLGPADYARPSEEHLPIQLPAGARMPALGEVVYIVPRHVCTTVNQHSFVIIAEDGRAVAVERISARGHEAPR